MRSSTTIFATAGIVTLGLWGLPQPSAAQTQPGYDSSSSLAGYAARPDGMCWYSQGPGGHDISGHWERCRNAPVSGTTQRRELAPSTARAQVRESSPRTARAQVREDVPSTARAQVRESSPRTARMPRREAAPRTTRMQQREAAPTTARAQVQGAPQPGSSDNSALTGYSMRPEGMCWYAQGPGGHDISGHWERCRSAR